MELTALVLDADVDNRRFLRGLLEVSSPGIKVSEADSASADMDLTRLHGFDLLLVNIQSSGLPGMDLLVHFHTNRHRKGTAVIVIAPHDSEELALQCLQNGAEDFICKAHLSESRMRRAIVHATARLSLQQELWESLQRAQKLAECDSLTGLANRHLFDESLKLAVTNNRRDRNHVALLLFDLDHFKWVNDSFGHDVGDELLKRVVNRVRGCLRGNEMFARLGGDEFAILIMNLADGRLVHNIAERIIRVLFKPFYFKDLELNTSPSIGVALHPDNGDSAEDLFKNADIAMYRAKRAGRNQYSFFSREMQLEVQKRSRLERKLRSALDKGQFELYFQPVVRPDNGKLIGAEALLRWQDPEEGLIAPDRFIVIAEETGLILELGHWVIGAACKQLFEWQRISRIDQKFRLAVNLSPKQLKDKRLLPRIIATVQKSGIQGGTLELELTETALLDNPASAVEVLNSIREQGVHIALDDFGTGFSSVTHLQLFPIQTVKLDRSLIQCATESDRDHALFSGLVKMIRSLRLEVVAEGIETEAQGRLCCDLGIARVQGFRYSHPLTAREFFNQYLISSSRTVNIGDPSPASS